MALSKEKHYPHEKDFNGEVFAEKCGICKSSHVTPKSLICLHSFCLKCLLEKVTGGEDKITCPTCDTITELPNKGVEGLKTNFMLIEKHERNLLDTRLKEKDTVITCTACEHGLNSKAIAFCGQCHDYMCEEAVTHSETRMTRSHEVISLEKFQSEGIPKRSGNDAQNVRMCPKHKDEKLKFYCETCEEPFCRDCEIIDHPRGEDHAQVYLEDAIKNRSEEIQKEAQKCKYVCQQIDEAIAQDERVEAAHSKAVEHTQEAFDHAAKEAQDKFSDNQTKHREKFTAELTRFDGRRKQNIDSHKETLKKDRSRARSALSVARMLAETGTQYDVADMCKDVITVLREFSEFKPIAERTAEVTFKSSEDCLSVVQNIPAPGTLKVGSLEWEQVREFGNGHLDGGRGLCFTPAGDIIVADCGDRTAKLFNDQGSLSDTILTETAGFGSPFDVCNTSDGNFLSY